MDFLQLDKFRRYATELSKYNFAVKILKTTRFNYYNWCTNHIVIKVGKDRYQLLRLIRAPKESLIRTRCTSTGMTKFKDHKEKVYLKALYASVRDEDYISDCYSWFRVELEFDDHNGLIEDPFINIAIIHYEPKVEFRSVLKELMSK